MPHTIQTKEETMSEYESLSLWFATSSFTIEFTRHESGKVNVAVFNGEHEQPIFTRGLTASDEQAIKEWF